MTRWVATRSGITRIHTAANSPASKTIGGPSPPSSTAVDHSGQLAADAR